MHPHPRDQVIEAVNQGELPKMLFKYRRFDDRTEEIFSKRQLWFSKLEDFEDPFDCQIHDAGSYLMQDVIDLLTTRGVEAAKALQVALHDAKNPKLLDQILREAKRKLLDSKGILSLSACKDNLLMWSQHCAAHTGFVLGFEVLKGPEFFAMPLKVSYSRNYPTYKYLKEPNKIATLGIATKPEPCAHEKEVRILKDAQGPHFFLRECLSEVILGCRTSPADRQRILAYLATYELEHVAVWEACCSPIAYRLDLRKVNP